MRVLHVIRSVDPTEGGPIESLVRSEPAWQRLGHRREIVSLDLPGDPWVETSPLPVHAMGHPGQRRWTPRLPWLRYGFTPHLVPWLRAHVHGFDVVVVNGLWNFAAFAARRVLPVLGVPYFVFTHGMLDPWFRRAHPVKHGCKQVVWWLAEGPLLHRARAVLFTSEGERAAAAGAFWPSRYPVAVVGYGTAAPPPDLNETRAFHERVRPGRPYLLFLGRLHAKKGGDLLLRAFAEVPAACDTFDLVMAGPDGGARPALVRLAAQLGIGDRVHWPGMLQGPAKWDAFHGCEAFVLPSHGENFGVAVAEALACGRPVLLSDRVNIAATIAAAGAGLVAPDTVEGVRALLHGFLDLPPSAQLAMRHRARNCFETHFDIDKIVGHTAHLLAGAVPA